MHMLSLGYCPWMKILINQVYRGKGARTALEILPCTVTGRWLTCEWESNDNSEPSCGGYMCQARYLYVRMLPHVISRKWRLE